MPLFCEQCGAPIGPDKNFCEECGAPVAPPLPATAISSQKPAPVTPETSSTPSPSCIPAPVVSPPSVPRPAKQGSSIPLPYIFGAVIGVVVLIVAVILLPGLLPGQQGGESGIPTIPVTPTAKMTSPPVTTPGTTPAAQITTARTIPVTPTLSKPKYIQGDVIQGVKGGQLYVILTNVWDVNYWDGKYELYKVHQSDNGRIYLTYEGEWGLQHLILLESAEAEKNYTKVGYTPLGQVIRI